MIPQLIKGIKGRRIKRHAMASVNRIMLASHGRALLLAKFGPRMLSRMRALERHVEAPYVASSECGVLHLRISRIARVWGRQPRARDKLTNPPKAMTEGSLYQ